MLNKKNNKHDESHFPEEIIVNRFNETSAQEFHDMVWQKFKDNPKRPIIIKIDSYGGNVYSLMRMLDVMDDIRELAPEEFYFVTECTGKTMSCGAVLLSHGDMRVANKNATLLVHQVSSISLGTYSELKKDVEETGRLNDKVFNIMVYNTSFPGGLKKLKELTINDWTLDADGAKKYGFVDLIGSAHLETKIMFNLCIQEAGQGLSNRKQIVERKAKRKKIKPKRRVQKKTDEQKDGNNE